MDDNDLVNKVPESDLQKMIREADRNQDGVVNYAEFLSMMERTLETSNLATS